MPPRKRARARRREEVTWGVQDTWATLPRDLAVDAVLALLDLRSLCRLARMCRVLRDLCACERLWRAPVLPFSSHAVSRFAVSGRLGALSLSFAFDALSVRPPSGSDLELLLASPVCAHLTALRVDTPCPLDAACVSALARGAPALTSLDINLLSRDAAIAEAVAELAAARAHTLVRLSLLPPSEPRHAAALVGGLIAAARARGPLRTLQSLSFAMRISAGTRMLLSALLTSCGAQPVFPALRELGAVHYYDVGYEDEEGGPERAYSENAQLALLVGASCPALESIAARPPPSASLLPWMPRTLRSLGSSLTCAQLERGVSEGASLSLHELSVVCCCGGDKCARAIEGLLRACGQLTSLHVSVQGALSERAAAHIARLPSLRRLSLQTAADGLSAGTCDAIAKSAARLEAVTLRVPGAAQLTSMPMCSRLRRIKWRLPPAPGEAPEDLASLCYASLERLALDCKGERPEGWAFPLKSVKAVLELCPNIRRLEISSISVDELIAVLLAIAEFPGCRLRVSLDVHKLRHLTVKEKAVLGASRLEKLSLDFRKSSSMNTECFKFLKAMEAAKFLSVVSFHFSIVDDVSTMLCRLENVSWVHLSKMKVRISNGHSGTAIAQLHSTTPFSIKGKVIFAQILHEMHLP